MAATQASAYLVLGVVGIGGYVAYKLLGKKRGSGGGSSGGATGSGGSTTYNYPASSQPQSGGGFGASLGGNKNSAMEQSSPYGGAPYVQDAMKGFDAANGETFKQEGADMLDAGASNSFLSETPSIANYQFPEQQLANTSSFNDWFSTFTQPLTSDGTLDSSNAGVAATESVSDLGDLGDAGDAGDVASYDSGSAGSDDTGGGSDIADYGGDGDDGGGGGNDYAEGSTSGDSEGY